MTKEQEMRALAILHSMAVEHTGWRASEERQKLKEMGYIEEGDTYR